MTRKLLFITGTRADFGKIKPLIKMVEAAPDFECVIFVTGMHTLSRYGLTLNEINKEKFQNIHIYMNQYHGDPMDLVLANTITGFSRYISENRPDMIVVHGDRVEAFAGAIVGSLNNILVAHIEGGELSGTIDGVLRHSITKLAHAHFVANSEAHDRLVQLGEDPDAIFIIGSPEIDVMLDPNLPTLAEAKSRYEIPFDQYNLVLFHSVTSELDNLQGNAEELVLALIESGGNYVVIYPNNDTGSEHILRAYSRLEDNPCFKLFPSLRFEYYLTLLKNSAGIIGNSSSGIREAPIYGVRTINVGTRQENRFSNSSILDVGYKKEEILSAIKKIEMLPSCEPVYKFGRGDSTKRFTSFLREGKIWSIKTQKTFRDLIR